MTTPFPPPNFIRTPSAVEGIELYMPAPKAEKHQPVVVFNCPHCGGVAAYDIKEAGLTCMYCHTKQSAPEPAVEKKGGKV